jgi:hypothetical protein
MESAQRDFFYQDFSIFGDKFNLTSTYNSDSQVPTPYGLCEIRKPEQSLFDFSDVTKAKTRLVTWLASRCFTHSLRHEYVQELQKYIPVDIFGRCGPNGPQPYNETATIINSGKFYLAFENSFCKDYITEKLFQVFRARNDIHTVPIVMGAGTYNVTLPPKSYIDVRDFESPKALAEYLLELDTNDSLYMEYFQWRKKYVCRQGGGMCEICRAINKFSGKSNNTLSASEIERQFSPHYNCYLPQN